MLVSLFISNYQTIWQCNLETGTLKTHQLQNDVYKGLT